MEKSFWIGLIIITVVFVAWVYGAAVMSGRDDDPWDSYDDDDENKPF